jgi:hypothetical protein
MKLKGLAIILVCLILAMSILDAPEYVRCTSLGICEFLDLHAHLDNLFKSDMIKQISRVSKINFYSLLEDLINSKELIKNLIIFCIPAILSSFKISLALKKSKNPVLLNTRHLPPLLENNITSQTLKFIEISVILS